MGKAVTTAAMMHLSLHMETDPHSSSNAFITVQLHIPAGDHDSNHNGAYLQQQHGQDDHGAQMEGVGEVVEQAVLLALSCRRPTGPAVRHWDLEEADDHLPHSGVVLALRVPHADVHRPRRLGTRLDSAGSRRLQGPEPSWVKASWRGAKRNSGLVQADAFVGAVKSCRKLKTSDEESV